MNRRARFLLPLSVAWLGGVALSVQVEPAAAVDRHAEAADYSGTYVLLQQTVTLAEVPVVADVTAKTRAISLQRLEQRGARLRGSGQLCQLFVETSSNLAKTELPAAFRRSLPPVRTDAEIRVKEGAIVFQQAAQTLVVGAKLEPGEALPTEASDPRVFDQDHDDKPGVTVRISGLLTGEIYLVQRSTSRLFGALRGGAFTGRIEFKTEQSILGATNRLLASGPVSRPVPSQSYFRLEKVADSLSCEDAAKKAATWR